MAARMRRLLALAGVLVVALGSLVLLSATSAFACSCVRMETAQQARAASEVFVGTITDTQRAGGGLLARGGGSIDWTVDVDRIWKGDPPATVTVSSSSQTTACGIGDLPQARPVLFFVSPSESGSARQVNLCGGTTLLRPDVEKQVTAALGPPHAPPTSGPSGGLHDSVDVQSADPLWQQVALVAALVLAVSGAAAAGLLVTRRLRRR